jgi:undecaprenyl-phosphate 4-deoxy-4-formamido-L-arabinose transferase
MASALFDRPKGHRVLSLCVLKKFVVKEMLHYNGPYTYLSGLVYRTTKNVGYLQVKHRERKSGKSGYSLRKLFGLWMNGFTAFSVKPLRFATIFGFIIAFFGLLFGGVTIINKMLNPEIAAGWSSIISIILIMNGIMLMFFGLIGEYVGRIYMSINNSPQYVIRRTINKKEDNE